LQNTHVPVGSSNRTTSGSRYLDQRSRWAGLAARRDADRFSAEARVTTDPVERRVLQKLADRCVQLAERGRVVRGWS
jgi:hypothetical protein